VYVTQGNTAIERVLILLMLFYFLEHILCLLMTLQIVDPTQRRPRREMNNELERMWKAAVSWYLLEGTNENKK
jgi:hypothetical protein